MSDDTIRQGIIDDLMQAIYAIPEINGVIDDLPPTNLAEPPPRPRSGFGVDELPFAYVVDGLERPSIDETVAMYDCWLPVEIAVLYRFERDDADKGCKRLGRKLLGDLQAGIMVDPNRGRRAYNTVEDENEVGEAVAEEHLGIAVWRGRVNYSRSRKNPASRDGTG